MVVEAVYSDPTGAFLGIFIILVIFLAAICIFEPSKTKKYRRTVVDLYIAGKVRQLAEADKVDLDLELQRYKTFKKKERLNVQNLDDTIESEVQERVTDEVTKDKK